MTAVRDAPSAAIEPLPRFLHLCYLGLAFFWACSMLTFRSSILLTGAADTPQYNTLIVVVSFLANMTVLLGVSALVERAPENLAKLSPWPFCGCILVGIAAIGGAGIWFAGPALSASLVIGSTLCGVGFGYLWGSWADVLGRVHPSRTALYAPASFLLTTIIFLAVDSLVALTPFPPLALMAPLPIASVLCLKRCRTESSQSSVLLAPHRTESQRYLAALATLVPLIIAALVFSCLFGFMWETAVLSVNSASTAHELPLVLNFVVAVLLLAFTVALQRRVNLSLVYQLLIPIAIVLFAALPFFWNVHPVVLNAIMSAVHGVFDVVIWYLVATAAYDYAVSGFVIGGLVRALSILARLVGIGIGVSDHAPPRSGWLRCSGRVHRSGVSARHPAMVSLAQRQTLGSGRGGRRENGDWRGDRRRQRESAFERLRSIVGLSCPNSRQGNRQSSCRPCQHLSRCGAHQHFCDRRDRWGRSY